MEAERASFCSRIPEINIKSFGYRGAYGGATGIRQEPALDLNRDGVDEEMTVDRFRAEYLKILSEGFLTGGFPVVECDDSLGGYRMRMTMHNKPDFKAMIGGQHIVHIGQSGLSRLPVSRFGTHKFDGNSRRTYRQLLLCRPALVSVQFLRRATPVLHTENALSYNFYDYGRGNSQSISYKHTAQDIPDITTSISALR